MRVPRSIVGKVVEIIWRDPGTDRKPLRDALKGSAALASWKEYGLVDDLTDGVVRVIHSAGYDPGETEIDEISYTVVPEALVEKVTVYTAGESLQ
jgi:hypothetical protein